MLRLAKLADYGLVIAAALCGETDLVKLDQVCDRTGLNVATVRKIMKLLVDGGVVESVRGVHGGYRLQRPASGISLADILGAVEGGVALTDCCRVESDCEVMSACTVNRNWSVVNQTVVTLFQHVTLEDMTRKLTRSDLVARLQGQGGRLIAVE